MDFRVLRAKLQRLLNLSLFFLFLTLPTQLAKHYWPSFSYIWGIRVDYLSPTVYLSDIFLVTALGLYFLLGGFKRLRILAPMVLSLFFILGLNIFFALNPTVALIKSIKLMETGLLVYLVATYEKLDYKKNVIKPLLISSFAISLIGITQFIKGSTLGGIFYYLGERKFTLETPGIALVSLWGRDFLRAYGTFSHPNSLAGFILLVIMLTAFKTKKYLPLLVPLGLCLILTFSRGTLIALGMTILLFLIWPWLKKREGDSRKIIVGFISLMVIISGIMLLGSTLKVLTSDNTHVTERVYLMQTSKRLFLQRPLLGVGYNNFILGIPARLLQPVHNIYALSLVEGGLVGLIFLLLLFYISFKKALSQKEPILICCLLIIAVSGLFDHYWLTLQQNMLIVSLVFGLTFRKKIK